MDNEEKVMWAVRKIAEGDRRWTGKRLARWAMGMRDFTASGIDRAFKKDHPDAEEEE
jgi:hypothetical protein